MTKEKSDKLDQPVSIHYEKFFKKFDEINSIPVNEWSQAHLVGYICQKYEQHYNIKYTFKFNASPSKSYEVLQIKKIANMLSSDPNILKEYIDWVFDQKVIQRKKRITSFGYFATTDLINDYKFNYLSKQTITVNRSTPISPRYKLIMDELNVEASTYGDLAFMKKICESGNNDQYARALNKLSLNGFNLNILDTIK